MTAAPGNQIDAVAGRPRDPAIGVAVLEVTRAVLVESGYSRLSFETIARRAGVTRPTMYRRWPSKPHLVHEAVFGEASRPVVMALPDSGDFAADVRSLLHSGLDAYARPDVRAALPGLMADLHGHPELRASVLDDLEEPVRGHLAGLVSAAIRSGQVRADTDAEALFDLIYGALFHRVIARDLTDPAFADSVADLVIRGTATS